MKNPLTDRTKERPYAYRVTRWVKEVYLVESDHPLENDEAVWGQLTHPMQTELEREIIQQVKP